MGNADTDVNVIPAQAPPRGRDVAPVNVTNTVLSPTRVAVHRCSRSAGFWIGGGVFALIVVAAILAPYLTPYDPAVQDLGHQLVPPVWMAHGSWAHPFGTDQSGRDMFAQLLFGARISLVIAFLTVLFSGLIGGCLGCAAGYWGGKVDLAVSYLLTVRLSLPVMLIALVAVAVVGNSLPLLIAVISGLLWDRFCVVTRTCTQEISRSEFVIAARCMGSSTARILVKEIMPNLVGQLTVVASIEFAHSIILAASMSFLGLGVQPPLTSWGLMISRGQDQLFFRPWVIAIPGVALMLLILSVNLIGDTLRDVTTPADRN